ncbi:MAG: inorganic pyrophosphatase family protein [Ignavibacteria bacterium]|nr:MAG: inorganic pyrophosphatase family protein [Ignavibacteria bacterium]KAF0160534.1 MAG: inorganic pyrophosphatase family protein [Ignavibacteria bacterium]
MINTSDLHFNPWHHVSPGKELPNIVRAVIEIPKGSQAKYELDKKSGLLKLDRVLFSSVFYPANYGFIPRTISDDKDPLDILVMCSVEVDPLCIIEAKVIGVMVMIDNMEKDEKIIAVAKNDISVNHMDDLKDLPPHTTVQLQRFFEDYKKLEHKNVVVEKIVGKEEAFKIINESIERYNQEFIAEDLE